MSKYLEKEGTQEDLEPSSIDVDGHPVSTALKNGVTVWKSLDYYATRQYQLDAIIYLSTGWYNSTARYVGPANLEGGKKYAYIIFTAGQNYGTGYTWAGNAFESKGYNYGTYGTGYNAPYSHLYNYTNATRPRLGTYESRIYQGTFIADDDGTSTYVATVASQGDNKTPSRILVFDYNEMLNVYSKAEKLENFNDEVGVI